MDPILYETKEKLFSQDGIVPPATADVNSFFNVINPGTLALEQGQIQSPNYVRQKSGWKIDSDGSAEFGDATFKSITIGQNTLVLKSTDDIASSLVKLQALGGGTLRLTAGTYVVTSPLTGFTNLHIIGDTRGSTTIYFAGTSANFSCVGSNVYTTGTITSISGGYNVTGSGTSWASNADATKQIFIGSRWYKIASVTDNTHLVLLEPFSDVNVTFPATYRIATLVTDLIFEKFAVSSSSGTAFVLTDCRSVTFNQVNILASNKGLVCTNVSEMESDVLVGALNTSNGIEFTNVGLANMNVILANGNGGNGITLNNFASGVISNSTTDSNTGDGINITSSIDLDISNIESRSNGSQGIEFVSGNDSINVQNAFIGNNTSDGIKLTATSDNVKIYSGKFNSNGGYGINIVASTCDNTVITTSVFVSNSSGSVNDAGNNTLIRGNVGVNDNSTSAASTGQTFVAGESLTAGDALAAGYYVAGGLITFDAASDGNTTTSGTTGTISFTVGSNTNRILVVTICSFANLTAITSVQYNGSALTTLDSNTSPDGYYTGYIMAPTTGTHNVTFTAASATNYKYTIYSFYNVSQSALSAGDHAVQASGGTNTPSVSVTPSEVACLVIGNILSNGAITTSAGWQNENTKTANGQSGDTGIVAPATAITVAGTTSGLPICYTFAVVLHPLVASVYAVVKASATPGVYSNFRTNAFIGIANETKSAGSNISVTTAGLVTTLSGLTPLSQYYLGNTNGTVQASAGTLTRKVGIATSTTSLTVTNIW